MRPRRLELSGFTSFKEPTEIDFEGSDFFALVGATGSGKSSVIDAMCFALYGSVPRYENRNLVAPVISHGRVEAKVLLEFSIDGKDYTAVRVVRRSGKGATTKEARLEAGGEVLAGNADELTERVTELIGLSFEHFTKCVVLPQGDFARFLHDKPSERQDLVIKLLNLGVYEKMRHLATARATEKKYDRDRAEQKLSEDLAFATPEALAEVKARAKRLADLRKKVTQAKPSLDKAEKNARDALARATEARSLAKLVGALEMPRGIDELGERVEEAGQKLAAVEKQAGAARKKVETAAAACKKLPERAPLSVALAAHDRKAKLAASTEPTHKALARAVKEHEAASRTLDQAEVAVPAAEQAKTDIERKHAALHVASTLATGRPCPVCMQPVTKLPKHPAVPGLDAAERTVGEARSLLAEARKLDQRAAAALAKAQSETDLLESQIAELDIELADHPNRAALEKQLAAVDKAEGALADARAAEDELRAEADEARKQLDALQRKEADERRRFETARDKVGALAPPAAARDSLVADWTALIEWAAERGNELAAEAQSLARVAEKTQLEREELLDDLLAACTDCELDVARDDDPLEAVVEAQAEAKAEVSDIQSAIETAKTLRRELKRLEIDHRTAEDLALHLSARAGRFENWLVNAALRRLVDGATHILNQLSNGQYALTIDEQGSFQVIDRHNADETRSAKTLSGGETFLASLSLALALADQLADLASDGAASLEAIFLDEGFGTLDADTLDTVAATVENLAESGRMVGIVTHVRELAERVPVQFRVKKDLRSSTVERVIA